MTRRTTTFAAGAAAAAALLGLGGCVESGRSATGSAGDSSGSAQACPWEADDSVTATARIGYQKVPNGDLVVKDLGLLEACMPNAKVTWTNFASGGDVVQAYAGKSIDLGLMGSSPATKTLSAPLNLPLKVVWIYDVIGAAESLVVRDKGITDLQGLKGKTIATPFGSTAHYSLLQALQDAGMDPNSDVKLINLEPDKMPAAWQGKQIDAAWVWDPTLTELKKTGTTILSSADTAKAGKPTFDVGTATSDFVEKNPEFMVQWAKAQDYAVKMISDEPGKAAESIAVELGIPPAEVEKQFAGYEFLPASEQAGADYLGGKMGKDLAQTAKFLLSQGGIDKVAPEATYADGVDPTPAEDASK
ncbi:taurine ABC transporter substrate-binding protein [Phycicoccus flavus]|uniref:taurine ABC transporter substrate-binding protein n=1 Tax=Phycicoccus flavus TaxID=2502783 RepID=UPI000FEBE29C|nr:ABC transporter substrate-binding protein [Phycicoccus flavus]NHA68542.1 ABC transporter substrate-binding protein [Phycicoccus flavus]